MLHHIPQSTTFLSWSEHPRIRNYLKNTLYITRQTGHHMQYWTQWLLMVAADCICFMVSDFFGLVWLSLECTGYWELFSVLKTHLAWLSIIPILLMCSINSRLCTSSSAKYLHILSYSISPLEFSYILSVLLLTHLESIGHSQEFLHPKGVQNVVMNDVGA